MKYKDYEILSRVEFFKSQLHGDVWIACDPRERMTPKEGQLYAYLETGHNRLLLMRLLAAGNGRVSRWARFFYWLFRV